MPAKETCPDVAGVEVDVMVGVVDVAGIADTKELGVVAPAEVCVADATSTSPKRVEAKSWSSSSLSKSWIVLDCTNSTSF